jgi:hypothetical protein
MLKIESGFCLFFFLNSNSKQRRLRSRIIHSKIQLQQHFKRIITQHIKAKIELIDTSNFKNTRRQSLQRTQFLTKVKILKSPARNTRQLL